MAQDEPQADPTEFFTFRVDMEIMTARLMCWLMRINPNTVGSRVIRKAGQILCEPVTPAPSATRNG